MTHAYRQSIHFGDDTSSSIFKHFLRHIIERIRRFVAKSCVPLVSLLYHNTHKHSENNVSSFSLSYTQRILPVLLSINNKLRLMTSLRSHHFFGSGPFCRWRSCRAPPEAPISTKQRCARKKYSK